MIIYSIDRFGKTVVIHGLIGTREYHGLLKSEARAAYLAEYNARIFVHM